MNFKLFSSILLVLIISWKTNAATFTVSSTADAGAGTLRQAILDANGNGNAGTLDVIRFTTSGTVTLASSLPAITQKVDIQGQTATSATAGTPTFTINCNGNTGITINTDNCIINTLCIRNGSTGGVGTGKPGILIDGASSNVVKGCYIGITTAGAASPNRFGIDINNSSTNNTIGGTSAAERNIISGNNDHGFRIQNSSTGTIIRGNYIGVNIAGNAILGNAKSGIFMSTSSGGVSSAACAFIGGSAVGEGNIIGGNGFKGIEIIDCVNIKIQGNYIGTNSTLTVDLGNDGDNVAIKGTSSNIIVGSSTSTATPGSGEGNTIAYSKTGDAVHFNSATQTQNPLRGNSTYCNQNDAIKLSGANSGLAAPYSSGLVSSTWDIARGTCIVGCVVYVFRNRLPSGTCECEGEVYLGQTDCTAGGTWSYTHNLNLTAAEVEAVSAVQTDASNNTSEYSKCNTSLGLPIKLTNFTAKTREDKSVAITWLTALESNTHHYEISKSTDGLHWELLGTSAANGPNQQYFLYDNKPTSGNNYYQLTEVDNLGKKTVYGIQVVQIDFKRLEFHISPNPSNGYVTVNVSNEFPNYNMEIINLNGSILGEYQLVPGKNDLFITNIPGVYFAKLIVKGENKIQKVVVR